MHPLIRILFAGGLFLCGFVMPLPMFSGIALWYAFRIGRFEVLLVGLLMSAYLWYPDTTLMPWHFIVAISVVMLYILIIPYVSLRP